MFGIRKSDRSFPLAARIAALAFSIVGVSAAIVTITNLLVDHSQMRAAEEQRVRDIGQTLASALTPALLAGDDMAVRTVLEAARHRPPARFLAVYDADRRQHAFVGQPMDNLTFSAPDFRASPATIRRIDNVYVAEAKIAAGSRMLGYVRVGIMASAASSGLAPAFERTIVACGLMLLFAIPLVWLSVRSITSPLRRLAILAEQNQYAEANVESFGSGAGDEIDRLGRAMAGMAQKMEANADSIRKLAFVDSLTNLPNRARLVREVDMSLAERVSDEAPGILFFIEIERFGRALQSLPRGAGDEILQRAANILTAINNAVDPDRAQNGGKSPLVARVGEHRFAVWLPEIVSKPDAAKRIQENAAALRQPFFVQGHQVSLRVSVGAAYAPDDGSAAEELVNNASAALTHAIQDGGGRARMFGPAMNARTNQRVVIESEMRAGIARGEFIAFFQPKIDLASGEVVGAEALARWRNNKGQLISPADFIPIAEETGLIGAIGDAILSDACKTAATWPDILGSRLRLAVNVSPVQFEDNRFAEKIISTLEATRFAADLLEIEITESVAVDDPQRVAQLTAPLKDRGVRLAIDDFGSGHSNLVALTRLPFDVFKIDQQFTKALGKDLHTPAIIEMILALAASLNYETVAEGVETARQAAFLRRRGCTLGQGFLYAKPLPPDQFVTFLREWDQNRENPSRAIA